LTYRLVKYCTFGNRFRKKRPSVHLASSPAVTSPPVGTGDYGFLALPGSKPQRRTVMTSGLSMSARLRYVVGIQYGLGGGVSTLEIGGVEMRLGDSMNRHGDECGYYSVRCVQDAKKSRGSEERLLFPFRRDPFPPIVSRRGRSRGGAGFRRTSPYCCL
jgi:hypothetical protein